MRSIRCSFLISPSYVSVDLRLGVYKYKWLYVFFGTWRDLCSQPLERYDFFFRAKKVVFCSLHPPLLAMNIFMKHYFSNTHVTFFVKVHRIAEYIAVNPCSYFSQRSVHCKWAVMDECLLCKNIFFETSVRSVLPPETFLFHLIFICPLATQDFFSESPMVEYFEENECVPKYCNF